MNNLLLELIIGIVLICLIYSYPTMISCTDNLKENISIYNIKSDLNYILLKTMVKRETYMLNIRPKDKYIVRKIAMDSKVREIEYPKNLKSKMSNMKYICYTSNGIPSYSGTFELEGYKYMYEFIFKVASRDYRIEKREIYE